MRIFPAVVGEQIARGKRGSPIGSRLALATVLLALLPFALCTASADAKGCPGRALSTTYELKVRGSHGYAIEIESLRSGTVALTASTPGTFAQYVVRGRSDRRGLKATFGRLGHVDLHFKHRPAGPFSAESIRLYGSLVFHGEQGFTSVSRRSVRGAVFSTLERACAGRTREPLQAARASRVAESAPPFITVLAAAETTSGRALGLKVQSSQPYIDEVPDRDTNLVEALLREHRPAMTIDRFAIFTLEPEQISASPPGAAPITGTVSPSFPFAGSATYSQTPGSPATWSGDLRAWLPGAGYVPLTGPGFSFSGLCHQSQRRL